MTKNTPNSRLGVKGTMTKKGADRVGLILAFSVFAAVLFGGVTAILIAI
jgi:hypothetical protein